MSDVSNFVRRSGSADRTEINKILAVINPLAFPVVENEALKERIILSPHVRKRTNTVLSGTDITTTNSQSRNRFSSSITILTDTVTPTAFPVTETLTGTLTFNQEKYGAGATFTGSQYISIPDNAQFDLTLPYFTMAFWFKANSADQGTQTIWSKGSFIFAEDYCLACGDFETDDYITTVETITTPGLDVRIQGNLIQDHCSACTDFDTSYDTSTALEKIRIIISDGTVLIDETVNMLTLFNGNWHSIVIISNDSVSDYCVACTDFSDDYSAVTSPLITIYMDKVSMGTINHSTVTGSLENTNTAYIGINNELQNPLKGSLAIFEYQGTNWTTTDVDSFHDSGRIRVGSQKAAFHFIGNDSSVDTIDKVY